MTPGPSIGAAVALLLGISAAAAQAPIETRGAWSLVPDGGDFALRTGARDAPDSTLSLSCRKEQQTFAFEIKSPALAGRPSGEEIRIGFKVDDDDQTWFNLATGPDGTIPIAQQTAFWIIHSVLTRRGAKGVAFTAADRVWQFGLDGLRDLTAALIERCGFEPPRGGPEGGSGQRRTRKCHNSPQSTNTTGVPFRTIAARASASQLVSRTQRARRPCRPSRGSRCRGCRRSSH
jgi:hypothetical protein